MSATNGAVLADQVRQLITSARQAGEPEPGRPALVKATGATDYAVRKTLAELANELSPAVGDAGDAVASVPVEPVPDTSAGMDVASHFLRSQEMVEPLSPAVASPETASPAGGKFVAWTGFLFGSIVSVAANVLAARIVPDHAPTGWQPNLYAQIGAAVWPLGLLISVEVLSRVRWRRGFLWSLARYGGAGTVALGSAVISYGHIRDVLGSWGYSPLGAGVGPLVVDGLMVVSGFALLAMAGGDLASGGGKGGGGRG